MNDCNSHSWTTHIKKLLRQYGLPTSYQLFLEPPDKIAWKKTVKKAVNNAWTVKLQEDAQAKTSLKMINISACKIGCIHPVWSNLKNPLSVQKATVKAQLLTQRYPLATSPTAGRHKCDMCPLWPFM